jgi:dTDP-4-dehydrorhamnose 3,5-epimerase
VTSAQAELLYKATDYYAPQWERTILWNDPEVNIDWPVKGEPPILSPKDEAGSSFSAAEVYEDLQP